MSQIPGYQLVRLLSRGGFGMVYLAQRGGDGMEVAVKILHLPNDENLRRFYREATVLHQQLANPNVVNLLDWNFDTTPAFIAMEFCAGGSLRSWVGSRPEWDKVASALSDAASGLGGIHAMGGFHRDMKPDNLLLAHTAHGQMIVKVGDFGFARVPDVGASGPMTRSARGTEGYVAPELRVGAPFDARCDVYSLGITGIELLTGSREPSSLVIRGDVPDGLTALLRSMVASDPARRPTLTECRVAVERVAALAAARVPTIPEQDGGGWGAALAVTGLLLLGTVAITTMNRKDARGSFHGSDGRFRSGRWG